MVGIFAEDPQTLESRSWEQLANNMDEYIGKCERKISSHMLNSLLFAFCSLTPSNCKVCFEGVDTGEYANSPSSI